MPVMSRFTMFLISNMRPYRCDAGSTLIPSGDAPKNECTSCCRHPKSATFVLYKCSYIMRETGSYFCPQCIGDAVFTYSLS